MLYDRYRCFMDSYKQENTWEDIKGALNPNFLNLTTNREKYLP